MEQNTLNKTVKTNTKKTDSSAIRFDKAFMKTISKIVDKANKKQFGRKVKPKTILVNMLSLLDENLIDKVIKMSQENSLTHKDKKELFLKENLSKFSGSAEEMEAKMMEHFKGYLSQNPV
ncbi:MAG: hypothetical protein HON90_13965 [Halobacteriovoraceae bacterium]|jgi:hypothetical protein|nr:hypothetical protein [Halobacteriovoraceae bacterium]